MSVIQRIRDRAAWLLFGLIALALLAFILQDAFMRKGSSASNATYVGKINGEKIERNDFESQVQLYDQMSNNQNPDNAQSVADVWNRTVFVTILRQEENKLGLTLTSKEQGEILFGNNPPQWMMQIQVFQVT